MKVDQNAIATPPVSTLKPAQPTKDGVAAQTGAAQPAPAANSNAQGLKVSISAAGRQAVDSSTGAAASANAQASLAVGTSESPLPQGLVEGIPWPVGFGPSAWPETQGAAKVNKLVTKEVPAAPEQRPSLAKTTSGAEIVSQAVQSGAVSEPAAELQSAVAGAASLLQEDAQTNAAAPSIRQRKAGVAYASTEAQVQTQDPKPKLDLTV